eukprot:CAMPEP_0198726070 /NCGR_PEP_ID=MMETSP1475-20131203/3245_1 /TAXON_ID= ORGANISM="Unidentified sp., Strain CCMP1999" /NCGR_SAMPLE_ID=MMETSP1475 /ASSEMBLY_ACC=CAM_ASM_001111 /LENGTH=151 /DNA_ID=CAMNT_0044487953 /DNA_START=136 /DNA_END=591 /DNA_ORIENTATION=+
MMRDARQRGLWSTMAALRSGKLGMSEYLVGEDALGNKYYENPSVLNSNSRWVEYAEISRGESVDSLKIPPEWHMWVHKMVDEPPTKAPPVHPKYQGMVEPNRTGTKDAYVPPHNPRSKNFIGHAKESVEYWDPSKPKPKLVSSERDVLDLK